MQYQFKLCKLKNANMTLNYSYLCKIFHGFEGEIFFTYIFLFEPKSIVLVNIPVEGIRLLDVAKDAMLSKRVCSGVVSAWCRLLRKSDVWPVDPLTFSKKNPQGQFRGPPTYTHQVWRRSIKGPRRSRGTNKQKKTRQTDKRCSNYSMIYRYFTAVHTVT